MEYSLIMTSCAAKKDAEKIIGALLSQKLAACIQTQAAESFYTWQGKWEQSAEILLLIKTRTVLFAEIEKAIKAVHPYDTPEIIQVPIMNGSKEYLKWLTKWRKI